MIGRTNACIINGQGGEANPIVVTTTDQMASLLTDANVGKFVKFEGGNPNYHTISVDDAFTNLYFNEAVDPDFEELWASADKDKIQGSYADGGQGLLLSLGPTVDDVQWMLMFMTQSDSAYKMNAILDRNYSIVYARPIPENALKPSDVGLTKWGWQMAQLPDDKVSALASYKYVMVNSNQSVWGKYIAKQNAFAASYTYGQVYNILKISEVISYKPVYALGKLSNQAPSDAIVTGYSAYDGNGKVITGAALKNNDSTFIQRTGSTDIGVASMQGISSIGKYAFAGWSPNLTIAKSITSIEDYAFENSNAVITYEEGEDSSLSLMPNAFSGFQGTSIRIPKRVNSFGLNAFNNCPNLQEVRIDDLDKWFTYYNFLDDYNNNPISVAGKAYFNDNLLVTLDLSEKTLSRIERNLFNGSTTLKTLILPKSGLSEIGEGAFKNCIALEKVVLPEQIDSLFFGGNSFENDSALKEVDTHNIETWYAANPTDTGNYPSYTLLVNNEEASHITFNGVEPSGVISITQNLPARTYQNCKNITGIQIEDSGDFYIYEKAFYNCTGLGPQINVGNLKAHPRSFKNCTSLQTLTTSNSTDIYDYAFEGCTSLKQLNLASGSVGMGAFKNCSALEKITTSGILSCYSLEGHESSFEGCSNVKEIDGDLSIISALPVRTKLQSVIVNYSGSNGSRVYINANLFKNVTTLHTFALGNAVNLQLIGLSAFEGCTSLSSVTFVSSYDDTSVQFSDFAFKNCTALTSLEIPACPRGLTLGHEALAIGTSDNKATIILKNTVVPSIQSDTFDTTKLEKIIVPAGKKSDYIRNVTWAALEPFIEEAAS